MTLPLIVRDEAEQDLASAQDWYDRQRQGLGAEFLDAVERKFDEIVRAPLHRPAGYRGVRMARTQRFPYVVYYRLLTDRIDVVAVMHGHRKPRTWRDRI